MFSRLGMWACKLNVQGVEVYEIMPNINHFQMRSLPSHNKGRAHLLYKGDADWPEKENKCRKINA